MPYAKMSMVFVLCLCIYMVVTYYVLHLNPDDYIPPAVIVSGLAAFVYHVFTTKDSK